MALDETWQWTSWVEAANTPGNGFPLQNLPYCVFEADDGEAHIGVGVGDSILDLREAAKVLEGFRPALREACAKPELNALMACGDFDLRLSLMRALRDGSKSRGVMEPLLSSRDDAKFRMPVQVRNYTDFYASIHHATNVGRLFRPDQPLLPSYKFLPIGYHGRASSLVVGGTPVTRPRGQMPGSEGAQPGYAPTRQLDYELEVAAYVGRGNVLGHPVDIDDAERHLFGISLLNDWSARDIQAWEYQPLGPFLGKSFATSVSPWVVSMEALAPFRVALTERANGDPQPLAYLDSKESGTAAIDLKLEVHLTTAAMRNAGIAPARLSTANFRDLYWSFAQMVAHHTSNGCNLLPGDLIASGTVSGPEDGMEGCLLERTRRGASPVRLPNGETRTFLEDGDEVILSGCCEREGLPRISLGECRGTVAPALVKA